MTYTIDERQLVELWTVISCLGHIREMPDQLGPVRNPDTSPDPFDRFRPRFATIAARSGRLCPAEEI
jgi:hypothetical protein